MQKIILISIVFLLLLPPAFAQQASDDNQKKTAELQQKIEQAKSNCIANPEKCDCSSMPDESAKKECDRAVSVQIKKANEFRDRCFKDLKSCDCSQIENELAREICGKVRAQNQIPKAEIISQCQSDPLNCDCSSLGHVASDCEKKKSEAFAEVKNEAGKKIDSCFADIDKCDCSSLPKKEYENFCSDQIKTAKACKETGQLCDRLEDFEIVPPGTPEFLKPFLKSTIKSKIESEKNKYLQQALDIGRECVLDPGACKCESIPSAHRKDCQERRALQIECQSEKNIDSCEKLDAMSSYIPENVPAFIKIPLDALLRPLINLQKEQIKGKFAEETKEIILACIDDTEKCDCSKNPAKYRDFCRHKVDKAKKCYAGDYDMCFTLMDEDPMPKDVPGFIRIFVEPSVKAKVKEVSEKMYMKMRHGKCEKLSLAECKKLWEKGELKSEMK